MDWSLFSSLASSPLTSPLRTSGGEGRERGGEGGEKGGKGREKGHVESKQRLLQCEFPSPHALVAVRTRVSQLGGKQPSKGAGLGATYA
uniref:Uncharacterized protein n=1 Tax=Oryza sativa subsp. japonica TaxID=39947 RepID=Q67UT9_ORYSJ|nr:hypothetical protein [Oryza sativa Japonica Group]